eukprot:2410527-Prymnesium_polylepis.1
MPDGNCDLFLEELIRPLGAAQPLGQRATNQLPPAPWERVIVNDRPTMLLTDANDKLSKLHGRKSASHRDHQRHIIIEPTFDHRKLVAQRPLVASHELPDVTLPQITAKREPRQRAAAHASKEGSNHILGQGGQRAHHAKSGSIGGKSTDAVNVSRNFK